MKSKSVQFQDEINNILLKHLKTYMKKMSEGLFLTTVLITIAEIVIAILVLTGHFSYYLHIQNNVSITIESFLLEVFMHTIYLWLIYFIFRIIFKNKSFNFQVNLISITYMVYIFVFSLCHWKYSYLSILFCLPVGITAPLGKKQHLLVFFSSIILSVLYSLLQAFFFQTQYNFLICVVSVVSIIVFFFISLKFKDCLTLALSDIEKYYMLSDSLNKKLQHDYLTGAFAKSEIPNTLENDKTLQSMAFLDLDDFKIANDNFGHDTGDYILRTLVNCITNKQEKAYRYGGDEFIILSTLPDIQLADKLEKIQIDFNSVCDGVFMCDMSFSAGIIPINKEDTFETLINKCDKVMYLSKQNGKNRITTLNSYKD